MMKTLSICAVALSATVALSSNQILGEEFTTAFDSPMMSISAEAAEKGFSIEPIFTVGEALPSSQFPDGLYTPPGILDGMGAWRVNLDTVRVYTNHELVAEKGYPYDICGDFNCTDDAKYQLTGARISFYDFDIESLKIKDSGVAYQFVRDANGELISDPNVITNDGSTPPGFIRFCSAQFVDAHEYGVGKGIENKLFFGPEETNGGVSGAYWALDAETSQFWQVPYLGRGAWESITQLDTKTEDYVAFIMPDDTSPRDLDGDLDLEASPLYLYVGKKDRSPDADLLARNGLRDGQMYVWVPAIAEARNAEQFRGTGSTLEGQFVAIDNSPKIGDASIDGSTGFDRDGFPTQTNLWLQADAVGSFQFTRPEDISTYASSPNTFVVVSTGRPGVFNDADTLGTIYTMSVDFNEAGNPGPSVLNILNDANSDELQKLRSPDNLEWADDGLIYVQEDRSNTPAFVNGVNPAEAQIVQIDPNGEPNNVFQIGSIDRTVLLDPSVDSPAVDQGNLKGDWESSGVLDVSIHFGREPGTLFTFSVQAHGLNDQDTPSRLNDEDLVEGGQLMFLKFEKKEIGGPTEEEGLSTDLVVIALALMGVVGVLLVITSYLLVKRRSTNQETDKKQRKVEV